jgi:hypothetical protein
MGLKKRQHLKRQFGFGPELKLADIVLEGREPELLSFQYRVNELILPNSSPFLKHSSLFAVG